MKNPSVPYVLPFAAFFLFLMLEGKLGLPPESEYPLRVVLLAAILWFFSREVISFHAPHWAASAAVGVLVFVIWIAPDLALPGYRQHWLFNNAIVGTAPEPAQGYASLPPLALSFRVIRAVVIVPIVEELFWRAWLMRWLIKPDFQSLPLGTFAPQAFAIGAVLFAAEHGSFWLVGLVAGILYNWWMVRTKSLGDCILAHAVTNGCLCAYVIATGKWEYL